MPATRPRLAFTLFVLFGINTMNFFDRQVLGVVAEPVRKRFQLDDYHLGWLTTAFVLLYAAVGVPLGHWADVGRRTRILAAGAALWSAFTFLSGRAWSFWSLFLLRLGVGIGEASCAPAASSLLGDLFPRERRGRAIAVFMLGLPVGLGLSSIVSGNVVKWAAREWGPSGRTHLIAQVMAVQGLVVPGGPSPIFPQAAVALEVAAVDTVALWESEYGWRAAFYVAGIPGLILGLLCLAIPEPKRGGAEAHALGAARREGSALRALLSLPTLLWLILSGALHNFNMYALGGFLSPLLQRYHSLDVAQAGGISGIVYCVGGLGILLGGWACDRLVRRRVSGRLEVSTLALAVATPCVFMAFRQPPGEVLAFTAWLLPGCLLFYVYYAAVYATIQDIVEPALRGTAMAVYFFAMYLFGAAEGPVVMGWISDFFAKRSAAGHGNGTVSELDKAIGLHDAMFVIPVVGAVLVAVLFAASRTVTGDYHKLQRWIAESAGKDSGKAGAAADVVE